MTKNTAIKATMLVITPPINLYYLNLQIIINTLKVLIASQKIM